jgi:hypothetical protein
MADPGRADGAEGPSGEVTGVPPPDIFGCKHCGAAVPGAFRRRGEPHRSQQCWPRSLRRPWSIPRAAERCTPEGAGGVMFSREAGAEKRCCRRWQSWPPATDTPPAQSMICNT